MTSRKSRSISSPGAATAWTRSLLRPAMRQLRMTVSLFSRIRVTSASVSGASGVQVFSLLRQMAARGVFQRNTAPYRSAGNSARIAG